MQLVLGIGAGNEPQRVYPTSLEPGTREALAWRGNMIEHANRVGYTRHGGNTRGNGECYI